MQEEFPFEIDWLINVDCSEALNEIKDWRLFEFDSEVLSEGLSLSFIGVHIPPVIPQNSRLENSSYKSRSCMVEAAGIESNSGVLLVVINDKQRQAKTVKDDKNQGDIING